MIGIRNTVCWRKISIHKMCGLTISIILLVGTVWICKSHSVYASPKGKVFARVGDLAGFHHDSSRSKRQTSGEQDVQVRAYTATFDVRTSQEDKLALVPLASITVKHGEDLLIPLSYLPLRRDHKFLGWKFQGDPTNSLYQPGATIRDVKHALVFYSVWEKRGKATLTYKSDDETKGTVSLSSEEVGDGSTVQGCIATAFEGNEFVKWSRDTDSFWSHTQTTLTKDVIERSAKKEGKFVPTIFTAYFRAKPQQTGAGEPFSQIKQTDRPSAPTPGAPQQLQLSEARASRDKQSEQKVTGGELREPKKSPGNWHKRDGKVFYEKNGKKVTGWQHLSGIANDPSSMTKNWFCFREDGTLLKGQHELVGGKDGSKHWFYFDEVTGVQIRGWKCIGNQGKWRYYSMEDGAMLTGQHELEGGDKGGKHWFYFDEITGAQIRGWRYISYQGKWCYYSMKDGVMLKGQHELEGGNKGGKHWFYFDEVTGGEIRGWKHISDQDKWRYYSMKDGTMLTGQHELEGGDKGGKHWFYFDEETGVELRNCWKKIPSQGKTCYYGPDGAMCKGAYSIDGKDYYFDEATGAVK